MIEQTKEYFKHKNWDEKTLYYIDNFINEFSTLFSEYVSREKLLKRIDEGLIDNIEFFKETDKKMELGQYDGMNKKLSVKDSLDDEHKKSVIFHEMIHATTELGKEKLYTIDNFSDNDELNVIFHHGVREGFTQYITELRNNYYSVKDKSISYPLLTRITKFFAEDVIGKEKYLYSAFNHPEQINWELIYHEEFEDEMDKIWKRENQLLYYMKNKDVITRLLGGLFDDRSNVNNVITLLSKSYFDKPITIFDEFNKYYEKINFLAKDLDVQLSPDTIEIIINKLKDINPNEEELEKLDNNINNEYNLKKNIQNFLDLDSLDMLRALNSNDSIIENIFHSYLSSNYMKEIVGNCLGEEQMYKTNELEMFMLLKNGLADILLENNLNPKILSYEYLKFNCGGTIFNLYDTLNNKYIGTYGYDCDLCDDEDISVFTIAKDNKFSEDIILEDEYERKVIKGKDNNYMLINEFDEKYICESLQYIPSYLENIEYSIQRHKSFYEKYEKYEKYENMYVPQIAKDMEKELILKDLAELRSLRGEDITPEKIENVTMDCTNEEIENIINEITNSERNIDEMLKEGVKSYEH